MVDKIIAGHAIVRISGAVPFLEMGKVVSFPGLEQNLELDSKEKLVIYKKLEVEV